MRDIFTFNFKNAMPSLIKTSQVYFDIHPKSKLSLTPNRKYFKSASLRHPCKLLIEAVEAHTRDI